MLDPLCTSTGQQVCLAVLTANSATTATGSDNDFAVARASVLGLGVGAAESHGTITEDANCQTSTGASRAANVISPGGGAVAQVSDSTTPSKSCRGQAPVVTNTSHVIGLGGVQVPLPGRRLRGRHGGHASPASPACCRSSATPRTSPVRQPCARRSTSTSCRSARRRWRRRRPPRRRPSAWLRPRVRRPTRPQCSDGVDNDGDGVIDDRDPGCHSDGNANNAATPTTPTTTTRPTARAAPAARAATARRAVRRRSRQRRRRPHRR